MPYTLVKGTFRLTYESDTGQRVGSEPDGDSVWFAPDDPDLLVGAGGRSANLNKGGFAQLRLEGIDSLELHYKGVHQQFGLATAARDLTLSTLGFTSVTYAPGRGVRVQSSVPVSVRGHILFRSIDPHGRPVAFALAGGTPRPDGAGVFLDVAGLGNSLNATLADGGHAYPAFYTDRMTSPGGGTSTGLPPDLRDRLQQLSAAAEQARRGLWADDETRTGARVRNLADLGEVVIWPKLFRRLVSYFKDGNTGLAGLDAWLRADPTRDDRLFIGPTRELGNMHDVINVAGNTIRLLHHPSELIIVAQ